MSNVVLNILSEFKGKQAFKDADSAVARLEKGAKKLGSVLGVSLGTAAVVAFGKATVNAFEADQKAAAQLSNTVKNLGLAYENTHVQNFVKDLSLATGVAKDELIPSMQKFLQVSGSVAESQKLLKEAIDISKGSGQDLATVTTDLTNAYVGNNKGLKKYALGLSQAELKTMSFSDVMDKFMKNFAGASQANLDTVAGKLGVLSVAAQEAKVKIGGALIDSASLISGSSNIEDLAKKMDGLANSAVNFIDRLSLGLAEINTIIHSNFWNMNTNLQKTMKAAYDAKLRRNQATAWDGVDIPKTAAQLAADKKAKADALKTQQQLLAAQNKQTAELKKQAALKKDSSIFDMQQIELVAALKGNLSDEDRRRAELQLAILNENDVLATSLTKQILMAQDATGGLYQYFLSIGDTKIKNPFSFLDQWILDFQTKLNNLTMPDLSKPSTYTGAGMDPALAALGVVAGYGANIPQTGSSQASTSLGNGLYGMQTVPDVGGNGSSSAPVIYNYFGGSVVTDQKLIDQVMNGTQLASLSGSPSQIGRIAGMFG
jgi:hypothetical protein